MSVITSFLAACAVLIGGVFNNQPSVMQSIPPQIAMVHDIVAPVSPSPQYDTQGMAVAKNLLPMVTIKPTPLLQGPKSQKSGAKATPIIIPAVTTTTSPTPMTTQSFLAATTLTTVERRDGPFEVQLATSGASQKNVLWDLSMQSVNNDNISYSCDPAPIPPISGSPDQNPTFTARTPYTCTISLTPQSGSDLREQSRQFSFTTPPGQLIVTAPSSMSTILQTGKDQGGFVFDNEDTQPITITQMTLDISYTGLSTVYGPLVFRVVDPSSGNPVGDYHMENFPADPSQKYTYTQTGMVIPISITIPAGRQKLLPVQLLGVDTMSISGVNPIATVALRGITADHADINAVINDARLSWSCVVTFEAYDPNATSGAVAEGDACGIGGN